MLNAVDLRLSTEFVHHFWSSDTVWESREVFNIGRSGELTSGSEAISPKRRKNANGGWYICVRQDCEMGCADGRD